MLHTSRPTATAQYSGPVRCHGSIFARPDPRAATGGERRRGAPTRLAPPQWPMLPCAPQTEEGDVGIPYHSMSQYGAI